MWRVVDDRNILNGLSTSVRNSGQLAGPLNPRRTNSRNHSSHSAFEWGRLKTGTPPRLRRAPSILKPVERGTFNANSATSAGSRLTG